MKRFWELIKYGFFGAITTGINLILFFILEYVGVHYIIANTIAYFIAVVINYVFNRNYVFEKETGASKSETTRQFIKFVIVRLASLLVDNSLFYILVDVLGINVYISRIGLSVGIIMATYVINKLFVFNKKNV